MEKIGTAASRLSRGQATLLSTCLAEMDKSPVTDTSSVNVDVSSPGCSPCLDCGQFWRDCLDTCKRTARSEEKLVSKWEHVGRALNSSLERIADRNGEFLDRFGTCQDRAEDRAEKETTRLKKVMSGAYTSVIRRLERRLEESRSDLKFVLADSARQKRTMGEELAYCRRIRDGCQGRLTETSDRVEDLSECRLSRDSCRDELSEVLRQRQEEEDLCSVQQQSCHDELLLMNEESSNYTFHLQQDHREFVERLSQRHEKERAAALKERQEFLDRLLLRHEEERGRAEAAVRRCQETASNRVCRLKDLPIADIFRLEKELGWRCASEERKKISGLTERLGYIVNEEK